MISSEVQRTLVKSPPELWAELSDPEALARHLGELGEIRITRSEPEKRVEWEAEGTNGSVLIKPSGWGTKVTLSVTREVSSLDPADEVGAEKVLGSDSAVETGEEPDDTPVTEAKTIGEQEDIVEDQAGTSAEIEAADEIPAAVEPDALDDSPSEPQLAPDSSAEPKAKNLIESELKAKVAEPEPRRGFLARLFGRRKPTSSGNMPTSRLVELPPEGTSAATDVDTGAVTDATFPGPREESVGSAIKSLQARFQAETSPMTADTEPVESSPSEARAASMTAQHGASDDPAVEEPEQIADLGAELEAAEELAVEEITAVLTAALDRLGAAHHRPFSRA
jgi:hypothetical protein